MASARSLLMMFVMAMLAASTCFAHVAHGLIPGRVRGLTFLKAVPGKRSFTLTTLTPGQVVDVSCWSRNEIVVGDPWWLQVTVKPLGIHGWVADIDVKCQSSVHNVCNIPLC